MLFSCYLGAISGSNYELWSKFILDNSWWRRGSLKQKEKLLGCSLLCHACLPTVAPFCTLFSYVAPSSSMEPRLSSRFFEELSRITRAVGLSSWVSPPGCPFILFSGKDFLLRCPPWPPKILSGRFLLVTYSSWKHLEWTLGGFSSSHFPCKWLESRKLFWHLRRHRFWKTVLRIVLAVQFPQKT